MQAFYEALQLDGVRDRLLEKAQRILAAAPLLVLAILAVAIAWWLGRILADRPGIARVARKNPFLLELARTTIRWLSLIVGLVIALEIMDATALLGAVLGTAGALGVALGFAFRDILENYLAGILMSLRQPFSPKDHVVIDGNEGVLVSLSSRATTLMTLDGNHLRVPNALVFRSVILNYTRNPRRRFQFDVGIGVEEDLVEAQRIGITELLAIDGVLSEPPPRAFIESLGDSNVQVRFQGWMDQKANDFPLIKSEAIRRVKLALEAAGMDMPEPIYRVQMREAKPAAEPPVRKQPAHVDTRAHRDVVAQIEKDPLKDDLLDPAAPRE